MIEYEEPKNLINENTLFMLSDIYANKDFRDFMINQRNLYVKATRSINNKSIEDDALELRFRNGQIDAIEKLYNQLSKLLKEAISINLTLFSALSKSMLSNIITQISHL